MLKDLPLMFVVAAIIWIIVVILFARNSKRNKGAFFAKHKSTFTAVLLAFVLTAADIWLFVQYIPTHFRKHAVDNTSLLTSDLVNEPDQKEATAKSSAQVKIKDSSLQNKPAAIKTDGKVYTTNKASIRFFSTTSAEDIEATNHTVACSFNDKTGDLRLIGLIKGFQFENELMQDHFNDKDYMNSAAFPQTGFRGNIQNVHLVNFAKEGEYSVTASGSLTIHGITQKITVPGSVTIAGNTVSLKSIFKIKRIDYGINADEISEVLEITVRAEFN